MGNTDKFEMIANTYAIDFGCGTGLVGMNLLNDFSSMLFLDTSKKHD